MQRDVALHGPRVFVVNPFLDPRFLAGIATVAAKHDVPDLRLVAGVVASVFPRRQICPLRMCQPVLPCSVAVNASPFEVALNDSLPNILGDGRVHPCPIDVQFLNHVVPRGHLSVPFDVVTNVFHDGDEMAFKSVLCAGIRRVGESDTDRPRSIFVMPAAAVAHGQR